MSSWPREMPPMVRFRLMEEMAGTWMDPLAVAVGTRTLELEPVKPDEGVGRRGGGGFFVTEESPMVMIS